ncbi:MAG: hypothetical protein ACRDYY_07140 [Acidimicrobiales bacterium]
MRAFWPVGEAAQADYEALREAALGGVALCEVTAGRFERAGLAGLIVRPAARPIFVAALAGATRPAWTPYADPRTAALADAYELLTTSAEMRRAERTRIGSTDVGC